MAEGAPMNLARIAVGGLATALAVNWLSKWVFDYPLAYCQLGSPAAHLYSAWALMILYALAAYIALHLFRGQSIPVFGGVVIFIGIVELPRLAEHAFRLGGTCG